MVLATLHVKFAFYKVPQNGWHAVVIFLKFEVSGSPEKEFKNGYVHAIPMVSLIV